MLVLGRRCTHATVGHVDYFFWVGYDRLRDPNRVIVLHGRLTGVSDLVKPGDLLTPFRPGYPSRVARSFLSMCRNRLVVQSRFVLFGRYGFQFEFKQIKENA